MLASLSRDLSDSTNLAADEDRRVAIADEARAIAEQIGDTRALAAALGSLHFAMLGPQWIERRLPIANDMLAAAEASADRREVLWARLLRLTDLAFLGDMDTIRVDVPITAALADEMREPSYSGWRPLWEGMLALRDGRWVEAERCIALVTAFTERAQHPNWIGSILAQVYTLRWGQGRLDELGAGDPAERAAESFESLPRYISPHPCGRRQT